MLSDTGEFTKPLLPDNVNNLFNWSSNQGKRNKYQEATKAIQLTPNMKTQEKWNMIVKKCKEAGKEVLGKKTKREHHGDPTLKKICEEKLKIKKDINAAKDQLIKKEKCQQLRDIKKEIKKSIKQCKETELDEHLKKLEESKDDSNR